jgi:hypothetical protein
MIYTREIYDKMMEIIHQALEQNRNITVEDAIALSVSSNSLISLFSQYYLRALNNKKEFQHPYYNSFTKFKNHLVERVNYKNDSLIEIAKEMKISYYRLAKIYLEERFSFQFKIADFLINPLIVPEERIRTELLYLINQDISDSPNIAIIKESMGKEYENLLVSLLNKYHFIYETESEMRKKGKPKTPDIWFTIPMATICTKYEMFIVPSYNNGMEQVEDEDEIFGNRFLLEGNPSQGLDPLMANLKEFPALSDAPPNMFNSIASESIISTQPSIEDTLTSPLKAASNQNTTAEDNYVIVNWIDSKAMFADLETFKEHYSQLHGYYLRYGRGMVIYWHGLVEEIYQSEYYDGNIIVRDSFPEKWIFPTGEEAKENHSPSFEVNLDILP